MTPESAAASIVAEIAKTVNLTIAERERVKQLIVERVQPMLVQPCFDFTREDEAKNDEQCQEILDLLKRRGDEGATNVELNAMAINHTGRVSDLRAKGFLINCQRGSGRIFRYRLVGVSA